MSRIGRKPIEIPAGVRVAVEAGTVKVQGPKGALSWRPPADVSVEAAQGSVTVSRLRETAGARAFHGLTRALVANMIAGVHQGYVRRLEIVGVGFRAQMKGKVLSLQVGFSHPVEVQPIAGAEIAVPEPTKVVVQGIDKQAVGQMAALIRGVRPPEPYKGKGIRYEGEAVRRKAGKAFVSAGA